MPKSLPNGQFDAAALSWSPAERRQLTKMTMQLFSRWKLTTKEQLNLLGLNESSRYMLQRYRKGETMLPHERDKMDRVSLLFVIYENLYALFPENEKIRDEWICRKNKLLKDRTPLSIMLAEGILGIAKIARFLDLQLVY